MRSLSFLNLSVVLTVSILAAWVAKLDRFVLQTLFVGVKRNILLKINGSWRWVIDLRRKGMSLRSYMCAY